LARVRESRGQKVAAFAFGRDRAGLDKLRAGVNIPFNTLPLWKDCLMTRLVVAAGLAAVFSSAAAAQSVPVTLSEWKIALASDTLSAGAVTFRVKNDGTMPHGFHVEGPGVDKETKQINARESASLTVTLKPGTYDLYCPLSELSHKQAGMLKKITVIAGAPKKP
jgi:uncharacterized cupredoxin-like copper-binding protein